MEVSPDTPLRQMHEGKTYLFCSTKCLSKFQASPADYQGKPPSPELSQAAPAPIRGGLAYSCPMHPEIRQSSPGNCPKCGMTLEPIAPVAAHASATEYTCPMHPEVVRNAPGSCPKCGMALEPRNAVSEDNTELDDMTRRFKLSAALALPVFFIAMVSELTPQLVPDYVSMTALQWIEFALATPAVLWGGWPVFKRGYESVVNRSLNMFTLIALGGSTAWWRCCCREFFRPPCAAWAKPCRCISKRRQSSWRWYCSAR
jgi:Cu+-exporting ATPase